MARYASGRKSKAISDRSGFKVRYTDLKTTWDNLRVEKQEWEPKHPQLTPAKNVIDATTLFKPRPDSDQEIVNVFIGYNYDIFVDKRERPGIGVEAVGGVGRVNTGPAGASTESSSVVYTATIGETGLAGTGEIGTSTIEISIAETGEQSSGAVGGVFAGTYTYTVTVQSVDGANKYFIDGVQQTTVDLIEGQVYIFDWSAATSHPFRFSTTSNGTHGSGSEYTTGVVKDDSAYTTQITVASDAPQLYYYCSAHSAMGGTANTPAFSNAVIEVNVIATQLSMTGSVGDQSLEGSPTATQVSATGETGTFVEEVSITETGVEATGHSGNHGESDDESIHLSIVESGVAGTSAVGSITLDNTVTVTGLAGTLSIGTHIPTALITETGLAGTFSIGTFVEEASIIESGVEGTGEIGTESVSVNAEWGAGTWGDGTWGN
jgi:hypothetical protein